METAAEIQTLCAQKRLFGEAVCRRISASIDKLGFAGAQARYQPYYDGAQFSLVTDPFTQSRDLVGFWHDERGQRLGQIRFHGDGSFYAEFDVVQPHPHKPRFFVEAIHAWGNEGNIKAEPKLLPIPE